MNNVAHLVGKCNTRCRGTSILDKLICRPGFYNRPNCLTPCSIFEITLKASFSMNKIILIPHNGLIGMIQLASKQVGQRNYCFALSKFIYIEFTDFMRNKYNNLKEVLIIIFKARRNFMFISSFIINTTTVQHLTAVLLRLHKTVFYK